MANYSTDFRENWIGGVPSGWTSRINNGSPTYSTIRSTTSTGGKCVEIKGTANGSKILSYDLANDATDIESLVRFRIDGTESGRQGIAIHRYSGSIESNTAGYALQLIPASSVKSLLISNDQTGATITFANYNWTAGVVYFARFRTVGNLIQARIWPESSEEPTTWNLSINNNAFSGGAGTYNGIGTYSANTAGVYYFEYNFATGGDTATRLPSNATFPNGYMYRKKITANSSYLSTNGYSGVLNFMATMPELRAYPFGGKIFNSDDPAFTDITFEDGAGNTLPWTSEVYNNATGRLVAWLKPTAMSNTANRDIYLYYGKPYTTTTQNTQLVYAGYSFAVWMNGGTEEYNRNTIDWWASRGTIASQDGRHGLTRNIQVGDIYKNWEDKYLLKAGRTLSMTIRFNQLGPNGSMQPLYQSTGSGAIRMDRAANGVMRVNFVKYGIADQFINWTPTLGRWYNLQFVVNGNNTMDFYEDGSYIGTFPNTSPIQTANAIFSIGGPDGAGQTRLDANVDEVDLVPSVRPQWAIYVESMNKVKDDFWTVGSEEISAIVLQDASHGHTVDSIDLSQMYNLVVDESYHSLTSDGISLSQLHMLSVDNSGHGQSISSIQLSETPVLILSNTTHSLTSNNIVIVNGFAVIPDNSTIGHVAQSVLLNQLQTMIVNGSSHSLLTTSPSIVEAKTLALSNAIHSIVDNIGLMSITHILGVNNSSQSISSDNVIPIQAAILSIANALHVNVATAIDIIQFTLLNKPDDSRHIIASHLANLSSNQILELENALHRLKSDELSKIVNWTEMNVDFGIYIPGRGTSNGTLTPTAIESGNIIPSFESAGSFYRVAVTLIELEEGGILLDENGGRISVETYEENNKQYNRFIIGDNRNARY